MKKVTSGLRTFLRTYHISIMEFPITRIYSYNRSHSSILFSSTLTFPVTIFHRLFTCHEQHEGSRSRSMIYGLSYLNTWDHLALPPPLHPIFHVAFWNRLVKFFIIFSDSLFLLCYRLPLLYLTYIGSLSEFENITKYEPGSTYKTFLYWTAYFDHCNAK